MEIAQPWPRPYAKQTLSGNDQAGQQANREYAGSGIAKKKNIGHRLGPVRLPMLKEVPADWRDGQDTNYRVKDQPPLNRRVKGTDGDGKTGNQFEEQDSANSARQDRGPSRVRNFCVIVFQLRQSLREPEST